MQQLNNFAQQNISLQKKSKISSVFDLSIKKNLVFIQAKDQGYSIFHDFIKNSRLQVHTVKSKQQTLQDTLDIYNWRFKTQMPIIKTFHVQVFQKSQQFVFLNVFNQHLKITLDKLYEIPFNQILYLLKQSTIGFQRLFAKFGGFQVTSKMIGINQNDLCKVWYNQNSYSNLIKPLDLSQQKIINVILKIFQDRTLKTNQGKIFFKSVYRQVNTFLDLLKYIQQFIRHYKTKVPTKFTLKCSQRIRETLRRTSLKSNYQQQKVRNSFSNNQQNSLNTSCHKRILISSLESDKFSKTKISSIQLNEKDILNSIKSYPSLNKEIFNQAIPLIASIINTAQSEMKCSNQTTIAYTHFDPNKLSASNNFSSYDFYENERKAQFSFSEKNIDQSKLKLSSEAQISFNNKSNKRKYSMQKNQEKKSLNQDFSGKKSYQILNSPLKANEVDRYQILQAEIHQAIQQQQKQCIYSSNPVSKTNSQQKFIFVVNFLEKKQTQNKLRKFSNVSQSESSDNLELSKHKAEQIFEKNGWRNQLEGILIAQTPMKKSIQIGKEINLFTQSHKFQYLKTPDLKVFESFIPSAEGQAQNYFFQ